MTRPLEAGVTLLGTGCPNPDLNRHGPSQVVWMGSKPMLVDCGHGVLYQMLKAKIDPTQVTTLFMTHLHSDHYAGFIHLILGSWNMGRRELRIFGPRGTAKMVRVLFDDLMTEDIDFRISVGRPPEGIRNIQVTEFSEGLIHIDDGLMVTACMVPHDRGIDCFALRFQSGEKGVVISGDTAYCQDLVNLARGADILVHECSYYLPQNSDPEVAASGAYWKRKRMLEEHSGPREAARVAREAGVKKLVLTHMTPTVDREGALSQCAEEFEGEVHFGEDLMDISA